MTTEQKAKAYDEAIERMKSWVRGEHPECFTEAQKAAEFIFPELAESEDEKIRKRLIDFFEDWHENRSHCWGIAVTNIIAWLEKQGQESKKVPIWKHWKNGIAGNGEGEQIYLLKYGNTYHLSSCISFECDYIELSELDNFMLEKQGEPSIKWNKNTEGNKPQVNHSVLMKTTHGIAEGEWQGEQWYQYRWSSSVKDSDVLSWIELSDLEKKGEQKIDDKVEPKFKVGDWVLYSGDHYEGVRHITKIDENGYYIERNGLPHGIIPFNHEICMRLWTIQDAKDGDVLYCENCGIEYIIILKQINRRSLDAYCRYNTIDGFAIDVPRVMSIQNNPKPATKEQRDTLEKAMADAGYTFDFKKKELKKIEDEEHNGEDDGIDSLRHTKNIFEKTLYKSEEQSLSFQIQAYLNTASDELYAKGKPLYSEERLEEIHKCMLMWQTLHNAYFYRKPAWSEKDESHCQMLQKIICDSSASASLANKLSDWLNSLKDRVQPQPNQEWSEEDEKNWQGIWDEIWANKYDAKEYEWDTYDRFLNWLKSLRPQKQWKPSEEQMDALADALSLAKNCGEGSAFDLRTLHEQLKKL